MAKQADPGPAAFYTSEAEALTTSIRKEVLPLLAGDPDGFVTLLVDLEDTIKTWQALRDDVKALTIAALPPMRKGQTYAVEGVASVEPTPPSSKRVYDNPLLASAIVEALPPAITPDGEDIRKELVGHLVAITGAGTASFSSWRVNALKALGIDARRYVTDEVRGAPGLIIRRPDKEKPRT